MKETAMSLKQHNKQRILDHLKRTKKSTKSSISMTTGLSVATCGNLLKELITSGQVTELPLANSTGGRPSRQFEINKDHAYIACFYISDDHPVMHIAYSVFNLVGETIVQKRHDCKVMSIDEVDLVTASIIQKYPQVTHLCYGFSGVVVDGTIIHSVYESFEHFDLKGYIQEKYERHVFVDSNVNAIASGCHLAFAQGKENSLALLTFPEELDPVASYIVKGNVLTGHSSFCGNLIYMITAHSDPVVATAQNIVNICCVIDPDYVILTGQRMDDLTYSLIVEEVESSIPEKNIPKIIYEEDVHHYHMTGLFLLSGYTLFPQSLTSTL